MLRYPIRFQDGPYAGLVVSSENEQGHPAAGEEFSYLGAVYRYTGNSTVRLTDSYVDWLAEYVSGGLTVSASVTQHAGHFRVEWTCDGDLPAEAETITWTVRAESSGVPLYLLGVKIINGIAQSYVFDMNEARNEYVTGPGELNTIASSGASESFPRDLLPRITEVDGWSAVLTINGTDCAKGQVKVQTP